MRPVRRREGHSYNIGQFPVGKEEAVAGGDGTDAGVAGIDAEGGFLPAFRFDGNCIVGGEGTISVDAKGRPVTYPLIPLYDGERVYMTSSTLFSRKLEHIDANAKVAVSITDPIRLGNSIKANDLLLGKDSNSMRYLKYFRATEKLREQEAAVKV
jgi:hypothetical protein